jgi:hypothetical protein
VVTLRCTSKSILDSHAFKNTRDIYSLHVWWLFHACLTSEAGCQLLTCDNGALMAILCVAACRNHCKGVIPFGNGHSGLDLCLAEKKIWDLQIEHSESWTAMLTSPRLVYTVHVSRRRGSVVGSTVYYTGNANNVTPWYESKVTALMSGIPYKQTQRTLVMFVNIIN